MYSQSFSGPLRRCSFFSEVLLLHWTLDQCGGKRSGAEVFCELQARGQSPSSVQPLKEPVWMSEYEAQLIFCLPQNYLSLQSKVTWRKVELF